MLNHPPLHKMFQTTLVWYTLQKFFWNQRVNITRQRRKMKKFKHLVEEGRMSQEDARNEVKSWLGSNKKLNAYRTCQNIRKLYKDLFFEDLDI